MTTIAYKDGVIAYDARETSDDIVLSDDVEKCIDRGGIKFLVMGASCDEEALIDAYFQDLMTVKDLDASAWVVDGGRVHCFSVGDGRTFSYEMDLSNCYAAGSGGAFAYGAMDMGATAKQAVQMAAKRDVYTGGKIKTYKVK